MENVIDSPESSVPKYRQKHNHKDQTTFKVKDPQDQLKLRIDKLQGQNKRSPEAAG